MKIKTLWIVLAVVVVLLLIFGGCTVGLGNRARLHLKKQKQKVYSPIAEKVY